MPVIECIDIYRTYEISKEQSVPVLKGVNLSIEKGDFLSLMGPSGSGKSTLMNIIACLDHADSGLYKLDGIDVSKLPDKKLAKIRGRKIGYIFQFFNLLPQLSVVENVELPLFYQGINSKDRRKKAIASLEKVGLSHRIHYKPLQLSGGEMQRVAIARALSTGPSLLLADEPTGNLDSEKGEEVMELFHNLHNEGITITMVTHDEDIAQQAQRVARIKDGILTEKKGNKK